MSGAVQVYPNPVADELIVQMEQGAYHTLSITNNIGQALITKDITAAQTRINIKALPAGIYYLLLQGTQGSKTEKFVKAYGK